MKSKISVTIKVETESFGDFEQTVKRDIETEENVNLDDLAGAIMDAIPKSIFMPFDVIELYRGGKRVGHAE